MRRSRFAVAAACGLALACGETSQHRAGTVVLVTIDTWRRDATGFLGGKSPSPTPFLDSLAARGLVAADAVSPVPHTGPSHWSILAGRWPWRDGLRLNGDRPGPDAPERTLPSMLHEQGFTTAAFVSAAVLDRRFGFARGFDHYDDPLYEQGGLELEAVPERRSDRTIQAALDWVRGNDPGAGIFLWVHLFDPHLPYAAPGGPLPGEHGDYLAEVAFADRQVRRLAEGLAAAGRPAGATLWCVLSDHGEGLGEHGEATHGLLLHGATSRIPLLFAGPGVPAGHHDALASTVDVLPTLLAALGVEAPAGDGRNLLGAGGDPERTIPLESLYASRAFGLAPVQGARQGPWLWESSPDDHVWNVVADPGELADLGSTRADLVDALRAGRGPLDLRAADGEPQDHETQAALRSLGYVAGGGSPAAGAGDVRGFVRDGLPLYDSLLRNVNRGQSQAAEADARAFLSRYPRSAHVWMHAGLVAVDTGRFDVAERRLRNAVILEPANLAAHQNLGNVLLSLDRPADAIAEYRAVLEIDPTEPSCLYNLGLVLWGQGHQAEARLPWEEFLRLHPGHTMAPAVRQKLGR